MAKRGLSSYSLEHWDEVPLTQLSVIRKLFLMVVS